MRRILISLLAIFCALPARAQSSWHNGNGVPLDLGEQFNVPAQVIGGTPNLLIDGEFENWHVVTGFNVLDSWTFGQVGGAALYKESNTVHGGSYSAKITLGNGPATLKQSNVLAGAPLFMRGCVWVQGTPGSLFKLTIGGSYSDVFTVTSDWQNDCSGRHSYNASFTITTSSPSGAIYFDDATFEALDVPTLFALQSYSSATGTASVAITEAVDNVAGIVQFYDTSNFCVAVIQPQNSMFGQPESSWKLHLACIIGGVTHAITDLPSIAYVPGAALTLTRDSTGLYTIIYNGMAVGSWSVVYPILSSAIQWGVISTIPDSTFSNWSFN